MKFQRPELNDSVVSLARSASPDHRCIGRNYMIEENVSDRRLAEVEVHKPGARNILDVAGEYFEQSTVGEGSEYGSSTFDGEVNDLALLADNLEPTREIVRLEIINLHVEPEGVLDFDGLVRSLEKRDPFPLSRLTRRLCEYPGSRPSFAAFKSDLATDLDKRDWLEIFIDRVGLYHYYPRAPSTPHRVALMEYTAAEVIEQANAKGIERCFSMPTVLEAHDSPAFFPAPRATGHGFSVDLRERDPRKPVVREILHVPLDYSWHHVKRLQKWSRTDSPDIETARERHLNDVRVETGCHDFGKLQSGI